MHDKILDRICEQALEEAREDAAIDGDYGLTDAPLFFRIAYCHRCCRAWLPRVPEPKQCRWCHSRSWRSPRGTVRRGRPPVVK